MCICDLHARLLKHRSFGHCRARLRPRFGSMALNSSINRNRPTLGVNTLVPVWFYVYLCFTFKSSGQISVSALHGMTTSLGWNYVDLYKISNFTNCLHVTNEYFSLSLGPLDSHHWITNNRGFSVPGYLMTGARAQLFQLYINNQALFLLSRGAPASPQRGLSEPNQFRMSAQLGTPIEQLHNRVIYHQTKRIR